MGLEDFATSTEQEEEDDNVIELDLDSTDSPSSTDNVLEGVKHIPDKASEAVSHPKLHNPEVCSSCGQKGEETPYWYYRCTTPQEECEVLTYVPSTRNHARM